MNGKQKLELTWIGKYDEIKVEPRILLEDKSKGYGDPNTENMLIHGDNLLALKALEQDFAGKIKCIYIDPPYNTGNAFEHYDDNLEHSIWLNLMKQRLTILRQLLSEDGAIFVQIDANQLGYLNVMLDEIFGRRNRINIITVKTKLAGVSGSYVGKSLQDNSEYILAYSKNKDVFEFKNLIFKKQELIKFIKEMEDEGKSWKYTSVLKSIDEGIHFKTIYDGSGDEIKLYRHTDFIIVSINEIAKNEFGGDLKKAYYKYIGSIFQTTNAQSSIRTRVMEATSNESSEIISAKYIPKSGRNKDKEVTLYFKGEKRRLFAWLRDVVQIEENGIYKLDSMGTIWDDIQYNNLTKEGNVIFANGKKPELLVSKVIELTTNENDLVLDSFLGSGTTAAVAHKMGRRWIGIELGDHCYTHCLPRLKAVVDGEQGGISKAVNWKGGGGFRFFELAPSLLKKDKYGNWVIDERYNADMLAAAMAKHQGFTYAPDSEVFWKQGYSYEKDYIFTTTQFITLEYLDLIHQEMAEDESLLICCKAFQDGADQRYDNINIQKIPLVLLNKCDFGVESYSLNIVGLPEIDEEADDHE